MLWFTNEPNTAIYRIFGALWTIETVGATWTTKKIMYLSVENTQSEQLFTYSSHLSEYII